MKKTVRLLIVFLILATLTPTIALADGSPTGCSPSGTCKP